MMNQYGAQRHRIVDGRAIGTIPVGTIIYVQDLHAYRERYASFVRRQPWIVEAWLPREYARFNGRGKGWDTSYMVGGHLAVVRCLRTGRRQEVADWLLLAAVDNNLNWGLNWDRVHRQLAAKSGAVLDCDDDDLVACNGVLMSCGFDEEAIEEFHAVVA